MQQIEKTDQVTFGAGLLERAAHLRTDPAALEGLLAAGGACILPLWRGKPLVQEAAGQVRPARLPRDHPLLRTAGEAPLFLGLAEGQAVFAADVSPWQPPEGAAARDPAAFLDQSRQALPGSDAAFADLRAVMARLRPLDAELLATARAMLLWHRNHRFCAGCGAASRPAQAGWLRECPACGAQHFPRTDPVVIMLVTHGNSVLLGRSPAWPARMYSLLAGFMEPGESIEAAVRREVAEETGVPVGPVRYLASQPWPWPGSLMIGCRAGALGREISLDPVEMADALWLSRKEVAAVFAGEHARIDPPRAGTIARFLLENWLADRLD